VLSVLYEIWGYHGFDYLVYRYMEYDAVYFNEWEETSRKFCPNVDVLHARLKVFVPSKNPPSIGFLQWYRISAILVSSNTVSFPHSLSLSRMFR